MHTLLFIKKKRYKHCYKQKRNTYTVIYKKKEMHTLLFIKRDKYTVIYVKRYIDCYL